MWIQIKATTEFLNYQATVQKEIMDRFPNWNNLNNSQVRREFQFLAIRGPGNMEQSEIEEVIHFLYGNFQKLEFLYFFLKLLVFAVKS